MTKINQSDKKAIKLANKRDLEMDKNPNMMISHSELMKSLTNIKIECNIELKSNLQQII